jgi:6-pyruvoyltetrahydropterin/6-carboxytetrahydropterin synthase
MMYKSTKTYGPEAGFSCCFRQWRAESHCRFLHGYPLGFHFEFETEQLDDNGWVVDFGSLKSLKAILENHFDHKLVVALDDPRLDDIAMLHELGIADVLVVPATGCEAFAHMVYEVGAQWLTDSGFAPRVRLNHVTVREHSGNSATYIGELL